MDDACTGNAMYSRLRTYPFPRNINNRPLSRLAVETSSELAQAKIRGLAVTVPYNQVALLHLLFATA